MRALAFTFQLAIFVGAIALSYYSYSSRYVEKLMPSRAATELEVFAPPSKQLGRIPIRLSQFSLEVDQSIDVDSLLEIVGDVPDAQRTLLGDVEVLAAGPNSVEGNSGARPGRTTQAGLGQSNSLSASQFEQTMAALSSPRTKDTGDFLKSRGMQSLARQGVRQNRPIGSLPSRSNLAQRSRGGGGGGGGGSLGGGSSSSSPASALDAILQPPTLTSGQSVATATGANQSLGCPIVASSSSYGSPASSDPSKFGIQNAQFWAFDYSAGDNGNGDLNGDSVIDVADARIQFDAYLGYLEQELDSPENIQVVSNNVADLSRIFDQFNEEAAGKQDPDPNDAISENFVSYMIIEFDSKGFYLPNNGKFRDQVSASNAWQFSSNPDPGLNK